MLMVAGCLLLLAVEAVAQVQKQSDVDAAVALLKKWHPEVKWNKRASAVVDVTCDGLKDVVVLGFEKDVAWLAVVPGSKQTGSSVPLAVSFSKGDYPFSVSTYPLRCRSETGPLPGCRIVKGCRALSFGDGETDPFNIYWDDAHKRLSWWRN
jgi:hypothetical protein